MTNLDIFFFDVKMIFLPKRFRGTAISSLSSIGDDDIKKNCDVEQFSPDDIYVFRGDNLTYFVVATGFQVKENDDDIFDVPF